ncbi:hypothetical protein ACWNS2_13955 [Planococcus plakortidis]
MDIVLKICINDGSEIIIDGFDKISFYTRIPNVALTQSGYSWRNDHFEQLLNSLVEYNFIGISRNDPADELRYQNHPFAYQNKHFTANDVLILQTNCVTTIIDLAKPL